MMTATLYYCICAKVLGAKSWLYIELEERNNERTDLLAVELIIL